MFKFNSEALIEERARIGLTQHELADRAGLSINIVSRYERGVTTPRARATFKLASALGIERNDLYFDDKQEVAA